ncbi:MSMEG_0569 family flavin-dependent oxidoreductase [Actinokineospora iranica]|uniref:Putative flavoprotein involved in K+ transport n=1 Tax=Actinokineospora iranica TaxID=1271860 RepID=A0A1G6MU76_9PSEU|nr:MSMEG_0569 family flavin-dependent oxidoreductase [Actinokineospora iranica]SDC58545.1 putative flavoprotein involved in K+ transport [Actinokineospora iranica]
MSRLVAVAQGSLAGDLTGTHRSAVVIGGGQAGLAMSHCLTGRGVDHLVLERGRIANEWRDRRWDSFCLVTPNWQCELPGFPYPGTEPSGFMTRDEIVDYLSRYAASFGPPLLEEVAVTRLRVDGDGRFALTTTRGTLTADQVVVATGPYQVPLIPRIAERLPDSVTQIHSADYRNPESLPPGAVLVVGTGQSGCQIAEDLHLAGRRVHLATGSAPRVARRYRGRDVVDWLADMGYYRKSIDEFDDADAVRMRANHYVTGRGGGRDIDLRAFARQGMRLHGRLSAVGAGVVEFADDLRRNLDNADAVSESIKDSIDAFIAGRHLVAPEEPRSVPVWAPDDGPTSVDLAAEGIASVVWCTGFGRDNRWIDVPVFDGRGYPAHHRGVTTFPGLYFLGLPWQWTWGSGRFCGVAADAEHLAARIAAGPARPVEVPWIAGTPHSTSPSAAEWTAPRTVA